MHVHVEYPVDSGHPPVSATFAFEPGIHARLRAEEDGDVFIAFGSATWVGYSEFGPEQLVSPAR